MSFAYEGKDRIYFGAEATLIETSREMASDWATPHIVLSPAHAWILGKYVEADNPNKNQHYFGLDTLRDTKMSIAHSPMNINHKPTDIVGAFVASELIYPTGEEGAAKKKPPFPPKKDGDGKDAEPDDDDDDKKKKNVPPWVKADNAENPFVESLAVMWKYYFPDAYAAIQKAAETVGLFYSMECIPQSVSTIGGSDDEKVYKYEGRQSPNYPEELNARAVPMRIHNPFFVGGALVLPPSNPAWSNADARQVSTLLEQHWSQAEALYEGIAATVPDLDATAWEAAMASLVLQFESDR